jgi:hypothetical protein
MLPRENKGKVRYSWDVKRKEHVEQQGEMNQHTLC